MTDNILLYIPGITFIPCDQKKKEKKAFGFCIDKLSIIFGGP